MKRISLNDAWFVYPRDDAFSLVTAIPDDAVQTSVPYDALWHEGQRPDSVNGGRTSYFDGQVYYFQRELTLDPSWAGKRLLLKFEGVFCTSFVYVNGSQVGTGDFAYASLTCDITDYVRWDVPNTLLVVCKCDLLSSRWYAGCGIVRLVWLLVGERVYTVPDTLWVETKSVTGDGGARIRVRATVAVDGSSQLVDARLRMSDAEGAALDERFPLRVTTGGYELDRRFYLRDVHLWSEDDRTSTTLSLPSTPMLPVSARASGPSDGIRRAASPSMGSPCCCVVPAFIMTRASWVAWPRQPLSFGA